MNKNNIKIIILAGGFGTRLQSVINDVPKPMAPILNKPFLDYQIKEIRKYFPTSTIYLLTFHLSEIVKDYFKNYASINIIKEKEPLGTGGSIKNMIKQLQLNINTTLLVFNGDTYTKPNLEHMIKKTQAEVSILGSFQQNCDRYGTLSIEKNNILHFNESKTNIKNSYINAGCYYFKNLRFFNKIEEEKFAIEDKFKTYLLTDIINIYKYNGIFIDIGIPKDYNKMITYIEKITNED